MLCGQGATRWVAWDKAAGAMVQISHRCASIVFTVLFVLAGIVLAVVPLGLWIYWDDTVYKPNTYSKLALLVERTAQCRSETDLLHYIFAILKHF